MKRYCRFFLLVAAILSAGMAKAQVISPDSLAALTKHIQGKQVFRVNNPDLKQSPFTGLTRKHWKEAALYLLSGAFSYVHSPDDPMAFPKQPGKSYPKDGEHNATEKLEGLCRTLFIAAPLLKEQPGLVINNIELAAYYRNQLGRLVSASSDTYISPRSQNGGPSQTLVEFGGLSVSLFAAPEILWDPLPQSLKDSLARTMLSYGNGPTIDMNWRFFNIFIMSFFKSRGYTVNETYLDELLLKSLAQYDGGGWYNDSPYYDYYSMWAFQMYGTLWSEFFGKKYYPEYAGRFAANFNDLKDIYPYMFSRKGEMIMWGRSISYRMGAAVPFPLMGFSPAANQNYGWMRRISSGTLLQFLQNPELIQDSIPTLGFYGAFEPAVQPYSCRGSVFWMGKFFLGLLVPESSGFWTSTENEGPWLNGFGNTDIYSKFTKGSDIMITDYPAIGASEIRAWCNSKNVGYYQGTENYNRLSYNSAFPWQADGTAGEVAMNYVFKDKKGGWEALRMFSFKAFDSGVYYRDAVLASDERIKMNLADIPLANGILRVDRNISTIAGDMRLGHYALPAVKGKISRKSIKVKGYDIQIIDNGVYQLAMVPLAGWNHIDIIETKGLNPVSQESSVLNASAAFRPETADKNVYATLMLWKRSGEKWSNEDLLPVRKVTYYDKGDRVDVSFFNGDKKTINFLPRQAGQGG